ncbi:MAG: hypothetical protein K8H84_04415 [Sulfuricella denitrificans]|nr:hypothetical protein [Sulfuricella denitrificans]
MPFSNIFNDEESKLVTERFAVVYAPQRKRARFPENCVQTVSSAAEAIAGADAAKNLYPGRVVGPSRSSEGVRLYYLVEWLGG